MTELLEDSCASARVKSLFSHLKALKLSEQVIKLTEAGNIININIKDSFKCLNAVCEFRHGGIVDWVTFKIFVLEG